MVILTSRTHFSCKTDDGASEGVGQASPVYFIIISISLHLCRANMSDRKAVIKNADMSEEMQQDAVECATQALEKYNIEKDIAAYIKKVNARVPWLVGLSDVQLENGASLLAGVIFSTEDVLPCQLFGGEVSRGVK